MKIVECIPNFSEGQNKDIVENIVASIEKYNVDVLDVNMDYDHNRSVITFLGHPKKVKRAIIKGIKKAIELIDMEKHKGVHPRMGAIDVIPFIPIKDITMDECIELAHDVGKIVGEMAVPVYMYGYAGNRKIEDVRRQSFQYEHLKENIQDSYYKPDYGPLKIGKPGASFIGARKPLIAFNINLKSHDIEIAKEIASNVRGSNGGLKSVKALGLHLDKKECIQISMNLTDYKKVGIYEVFNAVKKQAEEVNIEILNSEIIGLVPAEEITKSISKYIKIENFNNDKILESKWLGVINEREKN